MNDDVDIPKWFENFIYMLVICFAALMIILSILGIILLMRVVF